MILELMIADGRNCLHQHWCRVYTFHKPVGLGGLNQAAFIPEILFFQSMDTFFSIPEFPV